MIPKVKLFSLIGATTLIDSFHFCLEQPQLDVSSENASQLKDQLEFLHLAKVGRNQKV